MTKRSIGMLAAGLVAGATLVGVPTFAFASSDQGTESPSSGTNSDLGSKMGTLMNDDTFIKQMTDMMSKVMSDKQLQDQMGSIMGGMGDMSGGMGSMDGSSGSPGK